MENKLGKSQTTDSKGTLQNWEEQVSMTDISDRQRATQVTSLELLQTIFWEE